MTSPFAGSISGHSTFSRAAAEVLTRFTGDSYFPGGLGTFLAPRDTFLAFESGPTTDVALQWARYYDAADQAGISRIYGGIHPAMDDFADHIAGSAVGIAAYELAHRYFAPEANAALPSPVATLVLLALRKRRAAPGAARAHR